MGRNDVQRRAERGFKKCPTDAASEDGVKRVGEVEVLDKRLLDEHEDASFGFSVLAYGNVNTVRGVPLQCPAPNKWSCGSCFKNKYNVVGGGQRGNMRLLLAESLGVA